MSKYPKFISSDNYKNKTRVLIEKKKEVEKTDWLEKLEDVFDKLNICDGMTLSFHHHLRNGDYVLNEVAKIIKNRDLKNISIAASSIFPNNRCLVELIENGNITNIYTNYMNGPVSEAVVAGKLQGELIMNTHGGRARSIESGEIKIDVAFIATPTVDKLANGTGAMPASPSCAPVKCAPRQNFLTSAPSAPPSSPWTTSPASSRCGRKSPPVKSRRRSSAASTSWRIG